MQYLLSLLCLLFSGCSQESAPLSDQTFVEVNAREDRAPLYRVNTPKEWIILLPPKNPSFDTKEPLISFHVGKGKDIILITIHNFPTKSLEDQIPPIMQISRWKKQFETIDETDCTITPQSFGGFTGLFLSCFGTMAGEEKGMLAWSMQLSREHFQTLLARQNSRMRADYTIKAVGPKRVISEKKAEIIAFARSFELIDPIPKGR